MPKVRTRDLDHVRCNENENRKGLDERRKEINGENILKGLHEIRDKI